VKSRYPKRRENGTSKPRGKKSPGATLSKSAKRSGTRKNSSHAKRAFSDRSDARAGKMIEQCSPGKRKGQKRVDENVKVAGKEECI